MVCAFGSGRMTALARLLTSGNLSKPIEDDFGRQKLAMQYIHRELDEANEANLIDEQDMHIFDVRPLTDPLYLVSCNACRKPIKASQYAVHAELCTSLSSLGEIALELDGNIGHKKPPRKERKKLPIVPSATSIGERDKLEHLDVVDISALESQLETPSAEAKNGPFILECTEIRPGNTNSLATTVPRPRKRSKMLTAEDPPFILNHFAPASGPIPQETVPCNEDPRTFVIGSEEVSDHVVGQQMPRELTESDKVNKVISDVPVPLATKIYYSQRTNHLRSALGHLYYNAQTKECSSEFVHERTLQGNMVTTLTSSPNNSSPNQISDNRPNEEGDDPTYAAHIPDQNLAQSSELYSCGPGGFPPTMSISNQFSVNGVLRHHTSLGKMSSNYFSNSYSFADGSDG